MVYTEETNPKVVGATLKDLMREKGMKPADLAQATGINVRTIYSILNGHQLPGPDKLKALSSVLEVSLDDIFYSGLETHPIFSRPFEEARSYAHFEKSWFGPDGGERISVSRNFSVMNQSPEMRAEVLSRIYNLEGADLDRALNGFLERLAVIEEKERRRIEVVVESEIRDLLAGRSVFGKISSTYIRQMINGIIQRLEEEPLSYELIVIPRERFVVNYEIINRKVILFDLGTVFLRQQNGVILEHFLEEVREFRRTHNLYLTLAEQIAFLRGEE